MNQIKLIKTELKKDNNTIFEVLTFSNKMQKTYYSSTLHKFNFIASFYDKNIENYADFLFIEDLYLNNDKQFKTL